MAMLISLLIAASIFIPIWHVADLQSGRPYITPWLEKRALKREGKARQEPSIAETIKLAEELDLPFPVPEELPVETLDRHLKEIVNEIAPPPKYPVIVSHHGLMGALTEDKRVHFSGGIALEMPTGTWIRCECYVCKNVDKVLDGTFVPLNELPAQIKEKESDYWEGIKALANVYGRGRVEEEDHA